MNVSNKFIIFMLILSFTAACRTNRNIHRKDRKAEAYDTGMYKGTEDEKKYTQSLKLRKAEISLSLNGNEESTHATIGIIRDSIMVVSVVPVAGIEVMRIYCTRDSLTVINRQDKTYSHSAIKSLQEKYNLRVDYMGLQSVFSNELFMYGYNESTEYQVNELEGNDQNRLVEYRIWKEAKEDILQQVYFDRENELMRKVHITDFKRKVLIDIDYEDFIEIEEKVFPRNISMKIDDPWNKINIRIRAERIQFNDEVIIREIIPGGYKRIQL